MNQNNNIKIMDLQICREINLLKEAENIVIYGAAEKGIEVYRRLDMAKIHLNFFCDWDVRKWGTCIDGIKIISPFQLKKFCQDKNQNLYIIVCITHLNEFISMLSHMEIGEINVISYWGISTALFINKNTLYEKDSLILDILKLENEQRKYNFIQYRKNDYLELLGVEDDAVWIIQPGKTASTTLETRFHEQGIPFIKKHYLVYPEYAIGPEYKHSLKKVIEQRKKRLKVIVAVREPLSKDYATFWQMFSENIGPALLMPILNKDFQKMYEDFVEILLKGSEYGRIKLGEVMPWIWYDEFQWMDEQVKGGLGIDIFSYPFDKEKGYSIIKQDNIELLLLKVECLEDNMEIISKFVGTEGLSKANANVAENKWYALAYKQFRKDVKISSKYVDHYYKENNKMDHFYTEEEKQLFLKNWESNIVRELC